MASTIVLNTCDNLERKNVFQAQYYLQYTGAELHRAACVHLRQPYPNPRQGVLLCPSNGPRRWIYPHVRLSDQSVLPNDTICIIPLPMPTAPSPPAFAPSQYLPTGLYTPGFVPPPTSPSYVSPRAPPPIDSSPTPKTLDQFIVRLSDFQKLKDLGHGSFGSVYSAQHLRTGEVVAIKVMQVNLGERPQELRFFEREVQILAGVNHPTLLGFRGWVPFRADSQEEAAIVTEYMESGGLNAILFAEVNQRAPAGWDATRKFIALYGTAVGMMVLHQHRIIHRDLKAENVFLNAQLEPKVADFGLSKLVDPGSTIMQTIHGGTAPYMAPELFDETSDYGFAVDVYAFGILAYVALTNVLEPFPGLRSLYMISKKVQAGERPAIPPFVSAEWREVVQCCWEQLPANRPTFEQLVRRIGSAEFIPPSVDRRAVYAYQQKVLPAEYHLQGAANAAWVAPAAMKTPIQMLREAADAGDPFAANQYGEKLRDGVGCQRDFVAAAEYFRRAAAGGDVQGMINWGLACELGRGVAQNHVEAARCYRAAMDRGNQHGAFCYADMLENGKGVPKDPAGAVRCYKIAADAGHERAQAKYGLILENGDLGVTKNFVEAVRYYKISSDQGNPHGMYCYGDMLEFGKGVPKNMAEAVRLYGLAAQKRYIPAVGYLGWLLWQGNGVTQDCVKGMQMMTEAAEQGDVTSWYNLGQLWEKKGERQRAFECFAKASEKGHAIAVFKVARCLEDGVGVAQDLNGAAARYQQLITASNHVEAMIRLAQLKMSGKMGKADTDGGIQLLKRAAALGSDTANSLLRQRRK